MARTKRFTKRTNSTTSNGNQLTSNEQEQSLNSLVPTQELNSQPRDLMVHQQVPHAQSAPQPATSSTAQPTSQPPQSDPLGGQSQPSNQIPRNPSQRTCNKYWVVDVLVFYLLLALNNNIIADNGVADQERLRVRDLLVLPPHKRVVIEWNEDNQPVGEAAGLLGGFLGHIACNPNIFPISYARWPDVPKIYKEDVWVNTIKRRFVMDNDDHYHYCTGNMGKKWKDNRWRLANEIYEKDKSFQENLDLYPDGMTREQWASFLTYKTSEKAKKYSIINTANRQKQTIPHTLGAKTLARRKRELEIEEGHKYSRGEMYAVSHKKKDGNFVNDEAMLKNDQLLQQLEQANTEHEAFVNVFGKEHPGRVRGMGFGVVPSQIRRTSTSSASTSSTGPTQAEYDALKGELDTIKGKMLELDTLKAQMALFMHNFGGHLPSNQRDTTLVAGTIILNILEYYCVVDLGSPGIRKSSHASHDPSDGPTTSNPAPPPP
ncbi:uncharacterized protein LOC133312752 [Gastrolobium bilobum]|uniref:uncharacterized protein LOC133312752 n=1 Tax=Gastrolobium bilobum TaxID=150636 RepID=UPI002AB31F51|nr:uncharacterized protein LOC133312752 [Gastrolobium bilobum]